MINGIGGSNLQSDGLACGCFDEDLHATTELHERRDVVI